MFIYNSKVRTKTDVKSLFDSFDKLEFFSCEKNGVSGILVKVEHFLSFKVDNIPFGVESCSFVLVSKLEVSDSIYWNADWVYKMIDQPIDFLLRSL